MAQPLLTNDEIEDAANSVAPMVEAIHWMIADRGGVTPLPHPAQEMVAELLRHLVEDEDSNFVTSGRVRVIREKEEWDGEEVVTEVSILYDLGSVRMHREFTF